MGQGAGKGAWVSFAWAQLEVGVSQEKQKPGLILTEQQCQEPNVKSGHGTDAPPKVPGK